MARPSPIPGQFCSPEEAAGRLSLTVADVRAMIRSGTLPAIRISPRVWRIPIPAVDRLVAQRREHGATTPRTSRDATTPRDRATLLDAIARAIAYERQREQATTGDDHRAHP